MYFNILSVMSTLYFIPSKATLIRLLYFCHGPSALNTNSLEYAVWFDLDRSYA